MRPTCIALALTSLAACKSADTNPVAESRAVAQPTDTARKSRSFHLTYEASLPEVPAGAKQVRLWIPVPTDTPDQKITNVAIEASHPHVIASIANGSGKSVCVESAGEPVSVKLAFDCTRYETHGGGTAMKQELAGALEPDRFIPSDGKVAAIAASMPDGDSSLDTGRALYWHTLERMKYDKPADGGGWGRGDAEWACDARYGNCTDFHSYFMGLARAKAIPARFEMGFSVPADGGTIAGYHCWAYFWGEKNGWVPVDISEADKDATKAAYFFGTLDENRVTMTGGRDVELEPRPAAGPLNFFVYPYCEVDGVESKATKRAFSCANLPASGEVR